LDSTKPEGGVGLAAMSLVEYTELGKSPLRSFQIILQCFAKGKAVLFIWTFVGQNLRFCRKC